MAKACVLHITLNDNDLQNKSLSIFSILLFNIREYKNLYSQQFRTFLSGWIHVNTTTDVYRKSPCTCYIHYRKKLSLGKFKTQSKCIKLLNVFRTPDLISWSFEGKRKVYLQLLCSSRLPIRSLSNKRSKFYAMFFYNFL